MTREELIELGFEFDILSQNIVNIKHKKRFKLNSVMAFTRKNGYWLRSLELSTIDRASAYIKEIIFIDQ
jgi:hypothetical protein